ncbi:MAG: hypothetical protein ACLPI9_04625 [Halobacteriota archaeon]
MKWELTDYNYLQINKFEKDCTAFLNQHPEREQDLTEALENIYSNPKNPHPKAHKLQGTLKGQRAYDLDYSNRIRYAICQECRAGTRQPRCKDCFTTPDNTIKLLRMGAHRLAYGSG